MRLVIEGPAVVTMDDAGSVYPEGYVVVEADRIAAVGAGSCPDRRPDDETIDASGMVALPGLVDLHFHTAVGKGFCDHLALAESLEQFWYPCIRTLDAETAYLAAVASYADAIRCGVTTVNDMYRRLPDLARAAADVGIRAVLSNDVAVDGAGLDTLADARAAFRAVHGSAEGRVQVRVGIEWLPLATPDLLQDARRLADELGIGIHLHLNESIGEVEDSRRRFGSRPTEVAYKAGILGPDCVAAHCVWLSDREIGLLSETGTHVSHNPISNAKLGNGIARIPDMLFAGINVGLGHDAAESSNTRDLFQIMKFAALVQRAHRQDPALLPPRQLLQMATRNGARALGIAAGELAPGRKADLILVDLSGPAHVPLLPGNPDHLMSHLAFATNASAVDTTIVDGQVLMRSGRLTRLDEGHVLDGANRALRTTLERIGG